VPGPPRVRYCGDYELLEEIGRGGMGVVFKARQVSLNRLVAVKMLLHGGLASEEFVKRFQAEAQAVASLQHRNIVAIHEVGVHEGLHYFSMDYAEGPNLAQLVRDKPLPPKQAARYVQLIAEAIQYAHQRGILHRDLKPSNVLLDQFDQPRITDFGLAKRLTSSADFGLCTSDLTLTGQVLGAPSYMPPEQAAGKRGQVGVTSDVYALGAILYHLLTGRPPFVGDSTAATLVQVQTQEPTPPRQLNPAVPSDLEVVCLKCLEKSPAHRYQSAAALAEDLARWQAGAPIWARPPDWAERVRRWFWTRPALAALALVLGVSVFLVLVLVRDRATRPASPGGNNPAAAQTRQPEPPQVGAKPGADGGAGLGAITSFDTRTSSIDATRTAVWSRGPDMLEACEESRAAVLDGKLYVVGGRTGHGGTNVCLSTMQVYAPDTDRWSYAAPLPEPLAAVGLVAHKSFLYCFGGNKEPVWWGEPVASAYRFDPRAGRWTRLAEMPIARSNFGAGVTGDRIYCFGGSIHWPETTSRADAYDPALDRWFPVPAMPKGRGECVGAVWNNRLVTALGVFSVPTDDPDKRTWLSDTTIFLYDPQRDGWDQPGTALALQDPGAGYLFSDDSGIYLAGLKLKEGLENWLYHLEIKTGHVRFFSPRSPIARSSQAAAWDATRGMGYVVGGINSSNEVLRVLETVRLVRTGEGRR